MSASTGRRFRPRFWPTAVTLVALSMLIGLGTWQLQRLDWKGALIAEMRGRMAAPAIAVPADPADPALQYRVVRLRGQFLHGKEFYLASRTHKGKVGLHIVTPMRLEDGRVLLVDRGWVPPELKDPATRAPGQIGGTLELSGTLRAGGWHGSQMFRPANQPEENLWLWFDLPAMAAQAGLENAETGVYVAAAQAPEPGGYPRGVPLEIDLVNNHLQYAITWYALAVALLVIYLLHQRRPLEKTDEEPPQDDRL